MHNYGTDTGEVGWTKFAIGLLSAVLSVIILYLVDIDLGFFAALRFGIPVTMYGGLLFVYERWLWRAVRPIGFPLVPDFAGTWCGTGVSSHECETFSVELTIAQSWTRISIAGRFGESESESEGFAFIRRRGPDAVLVHTYRNRPTTGSSTSMEMHEGTAELTLGRDGELRGRYYTGRGRGTQGTLSLTRELSS